MSKMSRKTESKEGVRSEMARFKGVRMRIIAGRGDRFWIRCLDSEQHFGHEVENRIL